MTASALPIQRLAPVFRGYKIYNDGKAIVGGRFLLIDCADDLMKLYEKNDFIRINKTES